MDKTDKKRERIVRCAFELIYDGSYNGVGVNEIVSAANVPKGSFYYYFGSKENLCIEAIALFTQHLVQDANQLANDTSLRPLERLNRYFDNRASYFSEYNYSRGCFAGNLALEMGDVSEPIREAVESCFQEIIEVFVKILGDAQAEGVLDPDRDVQTLAESIYDFYEGAMLRMKTTGSSLPLERFQKMLNEDLLK